MSSRCFSPSFPSYFLLSCIFCFKCNNFMSTFIPSHTVSRTTVSDRDSFITFEVMHLPHFLGTSSTIVLDELEGRRLRWCSSWVGPRLCRLWLWLVGEFGWNPKVGFHKEIVAPRSLMSHRLVSIVYKYPVRLCSSNKSWSWVNSTQWHQ